MKLLSTCPPVSIITINYNQSLVTNAFLKSILQITYPAFEVIVVDNASPEHGIDGLLEEFPEVKFIKSSCNLGFAGGNNLGLQTATGEYILFINNDTEVEKGFLEPLVACMQGHPEVGMASPKIKFFTNPLMIQYAGGDNINPYTGRGKFIGYGNPDNDSFTTVKQTQLIHGAAMLVSRKLIKEIGSMDDIFFLYYEELDWCERAKRAGYQLYYVGTSVIYHKESTSVGKESPLKIYYQTRNRLLFTRRNYSGVKFWSSMLFFSFFAIPKGILKLTARGRFDLLKGFAKGIYWNIKHNKQPKNR